MKKLYIDEPAEWMTRELRQIHTADPVSIGAESPFTQHIFQYSVQAHLSVNWTSCVYLAPFPCRPFGVLIIYTTASSMDLRQCQFVIHSANSSHRLCKIFEKAAGCLQFSTYMYKCSVLSWISPPGNPAQNYCTMFLAQFCMELQFSPGGGAGGVIVYKSVMHWQCDSVHKSAKISLERWCKLLGRRWTTIVQKQKMERVLKKKTWLANIVKKICTSTQKYWYYFSGESKETKNRNFWNIGLHTKRNISLTAYKFWW